MQKKEKQAVWLYPETKDLMMDHLQAADARSQSEFIEKSIKFYSGYLDCSSNNMTNYLGAILSSVIGAIVKGSEQRISRILFKLAIESAMQSHFLAAANDVDDEIVDKLRGMCVDEVRKLNGIIDFERAYKYQTRE